MMGSRHPWDHFGRLNRSVRKQNRNILFDFRTDQPQFSCMAATIPPPALPKIEFPEDDVRAILQEWFASEDPNDPFSEPNTLAAIPIALDSLRVVNVLLTLEERLSIEIPVTVIKRGGYRTENEMLGHLLPKIMTHFEKQR